MSHRVVGITRNRLQKQLLSRHCIYTQKRYKFPHIFKYPHGYDPVPPGYEHLKGRTGFGDKAQFTKEEIEALHVYWGLDKWGLFAMSMIMLIASVFLALYPNKCRMDRQTVQMQKNWVALNRGKLIDTPYEKLVEAYGDEVD